MKINWRAEREVVKRYQPFSLILELALEPMEMRASHEHLSHKQLPFVVVFQGIGCAAKSEVLDVISMFRKTSFLLSGQYKTEVSFRPEHVGEISAQVRIIAGGRYKRCTHTFKCVA